MMTKSKAGVGGAVLAVATGLGLWAGGVIGRGTGVTLASEATVDLGALWHGQSVTSEIVVRNDDGQPHTVTGAIGSCACQTLVIGKPTMAPGEVCQVRVTIDVGRQTGKFAQTVHIGVDGRHSDMVVTYFYSVRDVLSRAAEGPLVLRKEWGRPAQATWSGSVASHLKDLAFNVGGMAVVEVGTPRCGEDQGLQDPVWVAGSPKATRWTAPLPPGSLSPWLDTHSPLRDKGLRRPLQGPPLMGARWGTHSRSRSAEDHAGWKSIAADVQCTRDVSAGIHLQDVQIMSGGREVGKFTVRVYSESPVQLCPESLFLGEADIQGGTETRVAVTPTGSAEVKVMSVTMPTGVPAEAVLRSEDRAGFVIVGKERTHQEPSPHPRPLGNGMVIVKVTAGERSGEVVLPILWRRQ